VGTGGIGECLPAQDDRAEVGNVPPASRIDWETWPPAHCGRFVDCQLPGLEHLTCWRRRPAPKVAQASTVSASTVLPVRCSPVPLCPVVMAWSPVVSYSVDGDLARLGLLRDRDVQPQHPVPVCRLDPVKVQVVTQHQSPAEHPTGSFSGEEFRLFVQRRPLRGHGQHVPVRRPGRPSPD
jgi:hypothetical protein